MNLFRLTGSLALIFEPVRPGTKWIDIINNPCTCTWVYMCMYIYMYMGIHVHVYVHIHAHGRIHGKSCAQQATCTTDLHVNVHEPIYKCTCTWTCIHVHVHAYTCTWTCIHVHVHVYTLHVHTTVHTNPLDS